MQEIDEDEADEGMNERWKGKMDGRWKWKKDGGWKMEDGGEVEEVEEAGESW